MSFRDCINRATDAGHMTRDRAEQILRDYDDAFEEFQRTSGFTQAEISAARHVRERFSAEAAERRRVTQLQAAATQRQGERLKGYKNARGENDPGAYLVDVVSSDHGAGGSTLAGKYEAVRRDFLGEFTTAMKTFRARLLGGRRNKDTLNNMVREVFGEDSGDELAKGLAQTWSKVAERARTRFNAAGGHIGKRADWGLPQMHDAAKVRNAKYEDWREAILPRLDVEGMSRDFNEGLPWSNEKLELILRDAYENIRSEGYSKREPSTVHGSAKYNQRADHRFFRFKSADDWMAYSAEYGSGKDAFRVMTGHLENMALDIALMEELGPNPAHGYAWLQDVAKHAVMRSGTNTQIKKVARQTALGEAMFDQVTGVANMPVHEGFAKGAAAVRNYLSAAHLGSAIISSVTDFNTQRLAAKFIGLKSSTFLKHMGKLTTSPQFREIASESGLIFENAVNVGNAVARYEMENFHSELAAGLADTTIRASGLGWLTEVQRQAAGLSFMSDIASTWHGVPWENLDPRLSRKLASNGITRIEWEAINRARQYTAPNGLRLLRANEIREAAGQRIADLYLEAITSNLEFAVPSNSIRGRALINMKTQPGTFTGEVARAGFQFKSFPIAVMINQIGRIMQEAQAGRGRNALSYAASLFIGNTLLGALAVQMKDASKGRDPRDMTTLKFWLASAAQGGGAGIFGDFLFSDMNRFGGGIGQTLLGPSVGFGEDIAKFTVGNAQELIAGKDTNAGREFVGLLRNYTPGGSLWYLRLAYEREVLDQVQRIIDPDADRQFRRKMQNARQYDTSYFAPPGASVIQDRGTVRAPDFANVTGE